MTAANKLERRAGRRAILLFLIAAVISIAAFASYVRNPGSALHSYFLITALALSVGLLMAGLFVRRRGRRVGALLAAVERAARQDFSRPLDSETFVEFKDLALAVNRMSASTDRLLERLKAGAEVDRRILTSRGIGPVLDLLLKRINRFVDCRFASVALADFENESVLTVHSVNLADDETYEVRRIKLDTKDRAQIQALNKPLQIAGDNALFKSLLPRDVPVAILNLIPIQGADQMLGFLALGDCADESSGGPPSAILEGLQDRLTLAFSMAERERTLFTQAHFDTLTNLPNRFLAIDRLEQELARSERTGTQLGLLFIDLDRFKSINDSLGHTAGDSLLQIIAQRLSECFRDADTVARLGGDEFIVLLPEIDDPNAAGELADRVAKALEEPSMLEGSAVYASASVGIAVYPMDGNNAEMLLRNADAAMYRAKESGSGGKAFFTEELNISAQRRVRLERELRQIIRNQELELAFQPQISLQEGLLTGVEVLLRWPGHKVSPSEFVPLAEDTGLIHDIGFWVLDTACRAMSDLGEQLPRLSVNISPSQLRNGHFGERLVDTMAKYGISHKRLHLEITEALFVQSNPETLRVLEELAETGIGLTMDDFGTGQSSLRNLPDYPIHALKIDRSFVAGIEHGGRDRLLVETITHLAHGLKLPVIAEGIENARQLEVARELGCDQGQGFLFSRPITLEQLRHFMAGQATRRAKANP